MIKQLTTYLNFSTYAELSLLVFAIVFVAIVVRTLLTRNEITNRQANIVLDEKTEEQL